MPAGPGSGVAPGLALALFSAVTTALAHAWLKAGRDRLAVRAVIGLTGAAVSAPFCFLVPWPTLPLVPWLAACALVHAVYQLVLIRAYAAADFSVAYPIARGVSPLATALLGAAFLGERPGAGAWLGVVLVSAGILGLAAGAMQGTPGGRRLDAPAFQAALGAGCLTTAYTLLDAHAVRLAPVAGTFVAWFFVLDGLTMLTVLAIARRGAVAAPLRREGWHGVRAGLATVACFGAALFALRLAPAGLVSAVRETSVVFALLMARVVLGERVGPARVVPAMVVAGGAVLIAVAGAGH